MFLGIFDKVRKRFLDSDEIDGLSRDLAVSRQDIELFMQARSGLRTQLEDMAAHFGLDSSRIDSERWRALEIIGNCANCSDVNGCAAFLAGKATSFQSSDCPNAQHYRELSES